MQRHTISFQNALRGIITATTTQLNIRIHLLALTVVFLLAAILKVSLTEGLLLLLSVSTVFVAEMINTAVEYVCNAVTMEQNPDIGHAKDVAAGGVLVAAIFAAIMGGFIFVPKLLVFIAHYAP